VRSDENFTCNAPDGEKCQSASEQYWERSVLGSHRAPHEYFLEKNSTDSDVYVNRTYALYEFGQGRRT
jgi:hypothetical protein